MKLNNFVASIKSKGLMHTNRFRVEFSLPPALAASKNTYNYVGDLRTVLLYCDSAALPGMTISTQPSRIYGEIREMPYERLFDNISLSFYVDNAMDSKALFDSWINSIQDPVTRQFNYYADYVTDITIYVLDKANKEQYKVKLYECFPKSMGAITMDYSSKDVMKLQVSMNYKYWLAGSAIRDDNAGVIPNAKEKLQTNGVSGRTDPYGYSGQVAPDFRGGYIPGSVNVPSGGGYDPRTGTNTSDSANSIGGSGAIT
jgi:hypothetical protein